MNAKNVSPDQLSVKELLLLLHQDLRESTSATQKDLERNLTEMQKIQIRLGQLEDFLEKNFDLGAKLLEDKSIQEAQEEERNRILAELGHKSSK